MPQYDADLISPPDIMSALLDATPSLLNDYRALIRPIRDERDAIRSLYQDRGMISALPEGEPIHPVGCTDGALVVSPLALGDHLAALTVAVGRDETGGVGVVAHRAWSALRPHSADGAALVKAIMMANEIGLQPTLPDASVRLIDGSWTTPLIAILTALASVEDHVRDAVIAHLEEHRIVEAITATVAHRLTVACPKSDSSMDLWADCREHLGLRDFGLPDKVLASLILEDGEVLTSQNRTPTWSRFYATLGQVRDNQARTVATSISDAIEPLRQGHPQIIHAKPHGAAQAIRMEMHPSLDQFEIDDVVHSIAATVASPGIQEPLAQYVADVFAKNIYAGVEVQMENLRLDLVDSADMGYFEYLVRQYRTA